ncbi:RcnB family protein [Novosphingobium colocasiae]|uniref:RcnB family protein n=1 Tax=Novosphingobium colocasiae TaxID=1256513 RepID=UPI0035B36BDE
MALVTAGLVLPSVASAEERQGGWRGQAQAQGNGGERGGGWRGQSDGASRRSESQGNAGAWRGRAQGNGDNGAAWAQARREAVQNAQAERSVQAQAQAQARTQRDWRGAQATDQGANRPDRGRGDGNWQRGNSGAAPTGTPGRWSNDNRGDNARNRDNQRDNDNRWRDNDNRWRDRDRDGRNDRDRDRDRWRDNDNRSQTRWRGNDNRWHSNDGWRDRDNRWGNNDRRNWDRDNWRRDNRYDWRSYRDRNRSHYRMGRYYSPYNNWSYRRLSIGFSLGAMFYSDRYWIDDPWSYRLPPAYGPYRWVRYYDDALLVDTYSGEVVDVIYDIFW